MSGAEATLIVGVVSNTGVLLILTWKASSLLTGLTNAVHQHEKDISESRDDIRDLQAQIASGMGSRSRRLAPRAD